MIGVLILAKKKTRDPPQLSFSELASTTLAVGISIIVNSESHEFEYRIQINASKSSFHPMNKYTKLKKKKISTRTQSRARFNSW